MKNKITLSQLEQYLSKAAWILKGPVDASDFKVYIFPLLFFKRISDVYDEEFKQALAESDGDKEYASLPEFHRFAIPEKCHWNDVREKTTNVGLAIEKALRGIEKGNQQFLYGIFGDAQWSNKNKHLGNTKFKELSERLEDLRDKAELGLITSLEFVKELCKIARETVKAEKEELAKLEQKDAKSALTELFLETKTDQTPAVVERIVADIDNIVKVVRFDGWQTTASGERQVQKSLRKALLKYKLHKDQVLFDRAYGYIKEYY